MLSGCLLCFFCPINTLDKRISSLSMDTTDLVPSKKTTVLSFRLLIL